MGLNTLNVAAPANPWGDRMVKIQFSSGAIGFDALSLNGNSLYPNISLTGLTDNTTYDVYVQADCGSGDESEWVGPTSFTTLCGLLTTFPYTQDFENGFGCWDVLNLGSSNTSVSYTHLRAHET